MLFISADKSPIGRPLLIIANEVSGTTTLFRVDVPSPEEPEAVPEPRVFLGLVALGLLARQLRPQGAA